MSSFKSLEPFVLFVTNDLELEKKISPAFEKYGAYFSTQNTEVASQIIDIKRVDVLLIDESLYQDRTIASKYRKHIFDLYTKTVEKNPKAVTLVFFEKKLSNFINEFSRKSEVLIKLDRNNIDKNKVNYILQTFSRQKFKSLVLNDFKAGKKFSAPLFIYNDDKNGYELFLNADEEFTRGKMDLLIQKGHNRIFVKNEDLVKIFDSSNMYFSEEMHQTRKRYKFFLSYFLDHSADEKTYIGNQLSDLGKDIIKRLRKLISRFDNPAEALCKLPYVRWTEISHGLNCAIYIIIWGDYLGLKNTDDLAFAAFVHDHGKFEIDFKPGTHGKFFSNLTDNIDYKKHPQLCLEMLKRKCIHLDRRVHDAIASHHENFDGTGFPRGISGEDLTVEAMLLSIADLFDHFKTIHAYNQHVTADKAWAELLEVHQDSLLGTKYHPRLISRLEDFFRIYQKDKVKKTA